MPNKPKPVRAGSGGQLVSSKTVDAIDNMADIWRKLDLLHPQALAVRPPNTFTVSEYRTKKAIPHSTAQKQIQTMLERGILTRVLVSLPATDGKLAPTWAYSICK